MIHFIRGNVSEVSEGLVVVEASGVGYGIRVPASVIAALPPRGTEVKIHTYFSLTQNGVELYGFLTPEDRTMFMMLLGVSGIGPKGALGVLSALTPDELRMAIVSGDSKSISRAPGIGTKTAQRVVLELKDKLDAAEVFHTALEHGETAAASASGMTLGVYGVQKEAVEALVALGYSNAEAARAVKKAGAQEDMSVDQVLKAALKQLSFL